MKVIIAGNRDFEDYELVKKALRDTEGYITEVVSGRCSKGKVTFITKDNIKVCGADGLGEKWAEEKNIPVTPFPADWDKYGTSAGPIRNEKMAGYGEALIIFWDGKSRGSKSMISKMKEAGKAAYIVKT